MGEGQLFEVGGMLNDIWDLALLHSNGRYAMIWGTKRKRPMWGLEKYLMNQIGNNIYPILKLMTK